jgi:hypothetical protein
VSAYGESMVDLEVVDNLTEQIGEVVADHFYHYFKKVDSNAIKNPRCKRHEYLPGIEKHTVHLGGYLIF